MKNVAYHVPLENLSSLHMIDRYAVTDMGQDRIPLHFWLVDNDAAAKVVQVCKWSKDLIFIIFEN